MNRTDDPKKQPIPFGVNGPREDIEPTTPTGDNSASYNSGFPPITMLLKAAGGLPPKGQDMNQILYELSSLARWASAGALNVFDSTFSSSISGYPKGAVLSNSTFTGCWLNTTDANIANPENTDGTLTGWVPAFAYGTTALTGLAATNTTLTALQAANERITLAGVLTANISLIFPAWRKEWVVINNCTGAFTVTCKTPSGTGITVVTGGSVRIIGDGTNIISNESALISGALQKTANLSDLTNVAVALTNLGLGDAAKRTIGSGNANVPDIAIADNRYLKQSGGTVVGDSTPIIIRAATLNAALYLLAQQSDGSGAWYLGMPVAGNNKLALRSYANACEISLSSGRADVTVPLYIEGGKAYYPGNKPPLTNVWVSGEYTPVLNTATVVSHGIAGLDPLLCRADVLLKCVTANNGYFPGDFAVNFNIHSSANTSAAPLPLLTATQVQLNTGAAGTGLQITNKSSGDVFSPTLSNWRYVFRVFY